MEEEKIPKHKPHTSFNRRLSVAKNPEGNLQRSRKMSKFLFYWGNMTKGEYCKGYYGTYPFSYQCNLIWTPSFEIEQELSKNLIIYIILYNF